MTDQSRSGSGSHLAMAGAAAIAAAILAVPVAALGQSALGDGRALDANLSTTSRYNQPRQGFLLNRINEAIVTGTAPGGMSFRGGLGYTSPFAFRGDTAGLSQYGFERDSIYSNMATRRSAPGDPGRLGSYQVPRSSAGGATSPYAAGANVLTPMSGANLQQIARARYGTNLPELDTSRGARQFRPSRTFVDPSQDAVAGLASRGSLTRETLASITTVDPLLDRSSLMAASANGALTRPGLSGSDLDLGSADLSSAKAATRNALARGIDRTYDGVAFREGWSNRIAGASAASASAATPLLAGQDSYADYIARLTAKSTVAPLPQPGQPFDADTLSTMQQFSKDWLGIEAGVSGLPSASPRPLASLTDEKIAEISRPMPAIGSLAGNHSSQFADHVRLGETALGEGRYFDSESWFKVALYDTPDHPLAMAGLVNAQLGAGKFRSAAVGMRQLFETHPELINTRYEANLLPKPERLATLIDDLNALFTQPGATLEAGLLLAYVGHQIDRRDLIEQGLDELDAQQPDDALGAVLRRVWLAAPSEP